METTYPLDRFVAAQERVYDVALRELEHGKKETHWMWFIFPQLKELGNSTNAKFFGISGLDEARAYLHHPLLRLRLEECFRAVLKSKVKNPVDIFGMTDYLKFHSCLTLFLMAEPENELLNEVLGTCYRGIMDFETENIILNH